jgi:hypothetical protein
LALSVCFTENGYETEENKQLRRKEENLVRIKIEGLAVWCDRLLLASFVASVLAYVSLFILPTVFDLQVITGPSHDKAQKTSLYYAKHITANDLKVGDVLLYVNAAGETQVTKVTAGKREATIPTQAGYVSYEQTLGVSRQAIQFLGAFYQRNLRAEGRREMLLFVGGVLVSHYLLSCLIPVQREQSKEVLKATSQAQAEPNDRQDTPKVDKALAPTETDNVASHPQTPDTQTRIKLRIARYLAEAEEKKKLGKYDIKPS